LHVVPRRTETRNRRVVPKYTMAAKQTQHDAADALYRAIIDTLDKSRDEGSLTAEVLEVLGRAYASVSTNIPEQGRRG
jgi:hypothetical protein